MKILLINRLFAAIAFVLILGACYDASTGAKPQKKKDSYIYQETIVKGNDTGMIALGAFRRNNIADVLCQRWELHGWDEETNDETPQSPVDNFIIDGIAFFKDSSVLVNPFGKISLAKWKVETERNRRIIVIHLSDTANKRYHLSNLTSTQLVLDAPDEPGKAKLFVSSATVHRNMHNDPFHPVNNQWRVRPRSLESPSELHHRLKNCLLFFALYYRDHIKRQAETISFKGLPEIFAWYNRGIGLPDKDELSESWFACFYNKEQALQGYSILRRLIVDYEYKWPRGAPGWTYETHSVLEQMYHKIDDLKTDSMSGDDLNGTGNN